MSSSSLPLTPSLSLSLPPLYTAHTAPRALPTSPLPLFPLVLLCCSHFVPNLTLGAPIVKSLRKHTGAFLDCHLMVSKPEQWVTDFADAGANGFTFHVEATNEPLALIDAIVGAGMRAGIALKPGTPVEAALTLLEAAGPGKISMVLIMTVEPGFGGQSFMPGMMPKVAALRAAYPGLDIQVDGGLASGTIGAAAEAGE